MKTKDKTDAIDEIIQHGIDRLDSIEIGEDVSGIHYYLYNEDYFIIGTWQAKQFLETYGSFDAIGEIQEYETDNFGQVSTDLSYPEKVANMLAYIKGEEILGKCESITENWDKKVSQKILNQLKEEMEEQLG